MVSPAETLRPLDDARPALKSPPENVEVPTPVATILPPVRRKSPWVDSMPDVDLTPADASPPVKDEVPAPVAFTMPPVRMRLPADEVKPFADANPPAREEMPPWKVEVPRPETVMMFATEKLVVDAMGKVEAAVVEVAVKVAAVGDEVAAMFVPLVQ